MHKLIKEAMLGRSLREIRVDSNSQ